MRSIGAALPRTLKSLGITRRTREAQALWQFVESDAIPTCNRFLPTPVV